MSFGRHFKSLCKKNWFIWKRSLCASIAELVCPCVLMGLILFARQLIEIEVIPGFYDPTATKLMFPMQTSGAVSNETDFATQNEFDTYKITDYIVPDPLGTFFINDCLRE